MTPTIRLKRAAVDVSYVQTVPLPPVKQAVKKASALSNPGFDDMPFDIGRENWHLKPVRLRSMHHNASKT